MTSGAIPTEDEVVVIFASSVLYGVYLVSFALCLRWQIFTEEGWKTMIQRSRTTLLIVIMIFVLTTAYVSLEVHKSWDTISAAVNHTMTSAPGKIPWYSVAIVSPDHLDISFYLLV